MSKRRRMPVNVLKETPAGDAGDPILDGIVGGGAAAADDDSQAAGDGERPHSRPGSTGAGEWQETRRLSRAASTVATRSLGAVLIGLLPWPPLAFLALFALQLALLRALCQRFRVPFYRELARGAGACLTATILAMSVGRWLPAAGPLLRGLWTGGAAALATLLLGRFFLMHLVAGRTLLSLDPKALRTFIGTGAEPAP